MYSNVKRVPLNLKGPSQKRKRVESTISATQDDSIAATLNCSGRVVVSGITIQGLETKFKEEVEIGDTLILTNPQTHQIEERVVTVVMTNRSLMISEKLSSDFVSTVTLKVRKDSVKLRQQVDRARRLNEMNMLKKEELDGELDDPDESTEVAMKRQLEKNLDEQQMNVSYKKKTGTWSYKTVTEKVDRSLSREDLLDLRSRRVHDKYC